MKKFRRNFSRVLGVMLSIVIFWENGSAAWAAQADDHRMNVVFVLDQSGSMSNTDAGEFRYEALDLFLGLSTETGNYMGAVVFDDTIVLQKDIVEVDGKEDKNKLSNEIKLTRSNGDTDIGKAVELATQMLQTSGNPNLRSAIILLSDGNTDLPKDISGEDTQASVQSRQNAIAIAREKGINIHSVCLNTNGEAERKELQDISDATGGVCVEVKSAEDLKEVFNQFYNMIYSTETINLADVAIPDGGELEVPFAIPMIGVEEANIIINTLNADTAYNLMNPDGYGYIQAEMDDISVKAKTFTVIKLEKPRAGNWTLQVRGVAGDQVKVDMVYNASLSIDLSCSRPDFKFGPQESVQITAKLTNDGIAVTEMEIYQNYPVNLYVVDKNTETEVAGIPMTAGADGVNCVLEIDEQGGYRIQAECMIGDMQVVSQMVECEVNDAFALEVAASPEPVKEKSKVLPVVLMILLAVILIAVVVLLLLKRGKRGGKSKGVIRGRVQFSGYNDGSLGVPLTFDGTKGKMLLSRYLEYKQDVGVDLANTYLKAGDKDSYIYVISKSGYYTDANPDAKSKKIRLDSEITISNDIDFGKYLRITYIPEDTEY